jgi:hypothetical protein
MVCSEFYKPMGEKNERKNKGTAIAGTLSPLGLTCQESETFEGFPVPFFAEVKEKQMNLESCDWGPASGETDCH